MVTVFGARSAAEQMIDGVRAMHERVSGTRPAGAAYRASDPELPDWVQTTAAFGFLVVQPGWLRIALSGPSVVCGMWQL